MQPLWLADLLYLKMIFSHLYTCITVIYSLTSRDLPLALPLETSIIISLSSSQKEDQHNETGASYP